MINKNSMRHTRDSGVSSVLIWAYFPTRTIDDTGLDQVFLVANTLDCFGIGLYNEIR